jgi:hypothetical protein
MSIIHIAIGLIAVVVMVLGIIISAGISNVNKLMFGVPWLKWLTLDEIVAMGHSRSWCEILLPLLYLRGYIEIRISDKFPKGVGEQIEQWGLHPDTVGFYEFKFTKRWGRRRNKLAKLLLPVWQPTPM